MARSSRSFSSPAYETCPEKNPQTMNILFISYCSDEYAALGDLVIPNRIAYCRKHGYKLHIQRKPLSERGMPWDRIQLIREALKVADVVIWNGMDVLVMNSDFKVETILDAHPTSSAILTYDVFGMNSDNQIFRADAWSEQLLYAVSSLGHNFYKGHIWGEQEALIRFTSAKPYCDHTTFVEQNLMNSYLNELYKRPTTWPGQYKEGDWLLHLPGLDFNYRLEVIKTLLPKAK